MTYQFTPGVVPDEIQLWVRGDNPTDFGVHKWTDRSILSVMGQYEAKGNPLQIDVEHNNAEKPAPNQIGPTGGYSKLELRNGEPWLRFDWSAYAIDQIETKQRLVLSPDYDYDKTTGEIIRLNRVSLVGDPATYHARQLASAKRVRAKANRGQMNPELSLILAALKAAMSAEDPQVVKDQLTALVGQIEGLGGGDTGTPTPPAAGATAAAPPPPPAAGGDKPEAEKPAGEPDGDEAKKEKALASAKKTDPETLDMATRLAILEARETERVAEARVLAAGSRIPTSLRGFAKSLSEEDFGTFVKGLPEPAIVGVRASASATKGDPKVEAENNKPKLDPATERSLARAFRTEVLPTDSVTVLPDGRVQATHRFVRGAK